MHNLSKFELKKLILDMVISGGDGHVPSAFSIFDIVYVLYHNYLNLNGSNFTSPNRDYFVLSKGHGCLSLYVNLYDIGILKKSSIASFCKPGGILGEHPDMTKAPGAEASTGSLGHGLPFACGISYGLRKRGLHNKVCVLVGDGECHEGSIWEAANLAANLSLDNLTVIVDVNQSATQLLKYDDQETKWRGFGWNVFRVDDGHNNELILSALSECDKLSGPSVILASTIKGKGSPLIEGHGMWHHKIPNKDEYRQILEELRHES